MKCAWQELLNILPLWLKKDVDRLGRDDLQELRLRLDQPAELVTNRGVIHLTRKICREDLQYCINIASDYSPWTAGTSAHGYITALGGHRIGICGDAIVYEGQMKGVRKISSLCIRIARDIQSFTGCTEALTGSVLIIGKPGSGKTTLLRDLIRTRSDSGQHITVIDEREELFPRTKSGFGFTPGTCTDVLSGCPKCLGMEAALRSMSPDVIAVDEITAAEDCLSMLHVAWCGVSLLATAHAGSKHELYSRPVYRPILDAKIFSNLIILNADKSWITERIEP